MSTMPAASVWAIGLTNEDAITYLQALTNAVAENGYVNTTPLAVTIASGVANLSGTADSGYGLIKVAAESGTADVLDKVTLNAPSVGRVLGIKADSGDTITLQDGSGTGALLMRGSQKIILHDAEQIEWFVYITGGYWLHLHQDAAIFIRKLPGQLAAASSYAIASDAITPTQCDNQIDTQSAAATDDLATITATYNVPFVAVYSTNASRVITVKHGTGNIFTKDGADAILDATSKIILFALVNGNYYEVARKGFNLREVESKSATFTAEWGKTYIVTATATANLTTAVGHEGEEIELVVTGGTTTIDPSSTQTVDGSSTTTVSSGASAVVRSDGTNTYIVAAKSSSSTSVEVSDPSICLARVSFTSGDPWSSTSVTAGTTAYVNAVHSGRIGIWNGSSTDILKITSEFSISLSGKTTTQPYRLYVYDNDSDGVVETAELVAWTNSTTPPSDTLVSDGYYVKTGSTSHRAIADIQMHTTSQSAMSSSRALIQHIDRRMRAPHTLAIKPTADSWSMTNGTTCRVISNTSTLGETYVEALSCGDFDITSAQMALVFISNAATDARVNTGIGINTSTTNSAQIYPSAYSVSNSDDSACSASYSGRTTTKGKLTLYQVEWDSTALNSAPTIYGDNGATIQSGAVINILA